MSGEQGLLDSVPDELGANPHPHNKDTTRQRWCVGRLIGVNEQGSPHGAFRLLRACKITMGRAGSWYQPPVISVLQ